jgi:hypothetical protein
LACKSKLLFGHVDDDNGAPGKHVEQLEAVLAESTQTDDECVMIGFEKRESLS